MAYDPSKNETLWEAPSPFFEDEEASVRMRLSIERYNGGEPKLQIHRFYITKKGTESRRTPGRLSMSEVKALGEALPEVLNAFSELE